VWSLFESQQIRVLSDAIFAMTATNHADCQLVEADLLNMCSMEQKNVEPDFEIVDSLSDTERKGRAVLEQNSILQTLLHLVYFDSKTTDGVSIAQA
jgi:hypothetical protein